MIIKTFAGIGLVFLTGCAVKGPNFSPPESHLSTTWNVDQSVDTRAVVTTNVATNPLADPDPNWWHSFNDTLLDSLEQRAVAGNLDLQVALLRIAASRSQEQIARAQGLPNLKAAASYDREQLGLEGILKSAGPLPPSLQNNPATGPIESQLTDPINLYTVALDASWELDLFGKVTRSVEAAAAQSHANEEARNGALVALQAEVAQTYAQLRAAQALRALTIKELSDEQQILDLTKDLQKSGLGNQSDVESLVSQVAQNQALLPQYEIQITQTCNALAVLIGVNPGTLNAELTIDGKIIALPDVIAIGVPASLARRRPDIREAEENLHAATAETGVAIASLYPDLSLGAQYGLRNTTTKYLFNWASRFYSVGPSISLPIFQGGSLTANVHLAKAEQAAAAIMYRKTVLNALQEVENALISFHQDQLRAQSLKTATQANNRALALNSNAYQHGLINFITVLNSERQAVQTQTQWTTAQVQLSTDLITLYKALGGGWEINPPIIAADIESNGLK
ncbi:efflux transporter outer membrane subunit [Solimicrobium silvestre]|nr:efflux transporter outer membrane subunit [Solimicrobium silvestre]